MQVGIRIEGAGLLKEIPIQLGEAVRKKKLPKVSAPNGICPSYYKLYMQVDKGPQAEL